MNLQSQLQSPYSRDAWLGLLRTLFNASAELFAKPAAIADPGFHGVFTRVLHLGDLKTTDNKTAALLDIEIAPDVLLPCNQPVWTMLQDYPFRRGVNVIWGETREGTCLAGGFIHFGPTFVFHARD